MTHHQHQHQQGLTALEIISFCLAVFSLCLWLELEVLFAITSTIGNQ